MKKDLQDWIDARNHGYSPLTESERQENEDWAALMAPVLKSTLSLSEMRCRGLISKRCYEALTAWGFDSLDEVASCKRTDLRSVRGLGRASLGNLASAVESLSGSDERSSKA